MDVFDIVPIFILFVVLGFAVFYSARKGSFLKPGWREDSPTLYLWKVKKLKVPWAVIFLVSACTFLFYAESWAPVQTFIENYRLTPATINLISLTLAQFTHDGIEHLANNMLVLIFFGVLVEAWLGTKRFILLYFLSGYFALAISAGFSSPSQLIILGASSNICAILCAYAFFRLYIWRRIYRELMREGGGQMPILIDAAVLLYFLFADTLIGSEPGVAYGAHRAGLFFGGIILFPILLFGPELFWTLADVQGHKDT